MNSYHAKRPLDSASLQGLIDLIEKARYTFGCFEKEEEKIPAAVQALVDERATARAKRDFKESDRLREEIRKLGYEVRDKDGGQTIRRV